MNILLEKKYRSLLKRADIRFNGDRPWDIHIHHNSLYKKMFLHGSLGVGEAYYGWLVGMSGDKTDV